MLDLLKKAKELWSWYSFAAGVSTLFVTLGATAVAWLSTTWTWYWNTLNWAGVALAFLVAWLVFAFGIFLIGTGAARWRDGPAARDQKAPSHPLELAKRLYVSDIRFTFASLAERRSEFSMRVFNGTGRLIRFVGLSGHVSFNSPNNTNASRKGDLPAPSARADMASTVGPFQEWLIVFEQHIPSTEAEKLLKMLSDDVRILFDLHDLKIDVCADDDHQHLLRLPIWGGVSYDHSYGFGRIVYATMNVTL